jgi:hypothetical protein
MNIYLDIHGVLLTEDGRMANHVHEFLSFVTSRYPTYWLTHYCRGNIKETQNFLKKSFSPDVFVITNRVLPTTWTTHKTEAIDFSQPFLWFDDNLKEEDRKVLNSHDVLENHIEVDLWSDPDQLQKFITHFPHPREIQHIKNSSAT